MADSGFDAELIDRISYLIAHHHTVTGIDGMDYQILIEADFLVNAAEKGLGKFKPPAPAPEAPTTDKAVPPPEVPPAPQAEPESLTPAGDASSSVTSPAPQVEPESPPTPPVKKKRPPRGMDI